MVGLLKEAGVDVTYKKYGGPEMNTSSTFFTAI